MKSHNGYYLYNGNGDVVQLANDSGVVTKNYQYDAFGNEQGIVASDPNKFRYSGEYYDKDIGSIYLRARYYQPATGHFQSVDPHWNVGNMVYGSSPASMPYGALEPDMIAIIASGNLYVYCNNNPIYYFDPDGNQPQSRRFVSPEARSIQREVYSAMISTIQGWYEAADCMLKSNLEIAKKTAQLYGINPDDPGYVEFVIKEIERFQRATDMAIGASGGIQIVSSIGKSPSLIRAAQQMGKNQAAQKEAELLGSFIAAPVACAAAVAAASAAAGAGSTAITLNTGSTALAPVATTVTLQVRQRNLRG
jgi:RHS repeat-associated protein